MFCHSPLMKFRHELTYDAPPEAVHAMLADPGFRESVCEAMGCLSAEVSIIPTGEGMSVVVDQEQNTDDLPSYARTFAGDSTRAIQKEEWADASGAQLVIEAPGKPTSVSGTIRLEPDGAGTREVVELEIKVKVPLIGGKLEKLMAEKVKDGMDTEREVGAAYLEKG
jgi:carbon monoxide dehydrogenase subunit G